MSKIVWGAAGSRKYETGVDRGVLYVQGSPGVPWDGLISVDEGSSGGEAKGYYIDGVKYANVAARTEFEGTINAFYSPPEFDECDGIMALAQGLMISDQRRKTFDFTYRSKIGNDTDGINHGYKIHLIYHALAAPAPRSHRTMGEQVDPDALSWSITTKSPLFGGGAYLAAHFMISSRETDPSLLAAVEDILYGSPAAAPRMLTPDELLTMFLDQRLIVVDNGDGTFTATGPFNVVEMLDADTYKITSDDAIWLTDDEHQLSSP